MGDGGDRNMSLKFSTNPMTFNYFFLGSGLGEVLLGMCKGRIDPKIVFHLSLLEGTSTSKGLGFRSFCLLRNMTDADLKKIGCFLSSPFIFGGILVLALMVADMFSILKLRFWMMERNVGISLNLFIKFLYSLFFFGIVG